MKTTSTNNQFINNSKTKFMKQTLFAVLMICTFGLFLTGCQQDDIFSQEDKQESLDTNNKSNTLSSRILTEADIQKEILPIIQQFLNAQYDYLIKGGNPNWDVLTDSKKLQSDIDNYKSILRNDYNYKQSAYSSLVQWEPLSTKTKSFELSGNTLTLYNVLDKYSFESQSSNEEKLPGESSTITYQSITLIFSDGSWKVSTWKEKGITGERSRWDILKRNIESTDLNASKELLKPVLKLSTSYNRNNAVGYAVAHVNSPSSNYPDYSSYGGDCTNFVSQCLQAGGWTQVSTGANKWFHLPGYTSPPPSGTHRSPSWTGAQYLQAYFPVSGRIVLASYPLYSLERGDIIQLKNSSGNAYHSMIVTSKTGSGTSATILVHYRNASGIPTGVSINPALYWSESNMLKWKIANSYWSLA